jgi:hypothetical protein
MRRTIHSDYFCSGFTEAQRIEAVRGGVVRKKTLDAVICKRRGHVVIPVSIVRERPSSTETKRFYRYKKNTSFHDHGNVSSTNPESLLQCSQERKPTEKRKQGRHIEGCKFSDLVSQLKDLGNPDSASGTRSVHTLLIYIAQVATCGIQHISNGDFWEQPVSRCDRVELSNQKSR